MTRHSLSALAPALLLLVTPAWSKTPQDAKVAPSVPEPKAAQPESKQAQPESKQAQPESKQAQPESKQAQSESKQAQRPAPHPTTDAPESEAEGSTPQGDSSIVDYDARRRAALLSYKLGEIEKALLELRELTANCEEAGAACSDATRAELYVAVAIVLAGGKEDIKGAARLFHAALTRDPAVTVPRELATLPVQEAMRLANESTTYDGLAATEPSGTLPAGKMNAEPGGAPPEEEDGSDESAHDRKTGLFLLHAMVGGGADELSDAPAYGAAAVLGARFVDSSAWTTAIRGRAAVIGANQEAVVGASLVMGGTWPSSRRKTMGYFLGGLGLDSYGGEGGVSANAMGGVTLGGFLVGGGVDMGASDYGGFMMMCLHLGWGARL